MAKVEKLPSGSYRIRVNIGKTPEGKYIRKSFTGSDKRQLMRIAAEYADQHRTAVQDSSFGKTLDAYITARTPVLSPSTIRAYTCMAKTLKRDYGTFCASLVGDIDKTDVQQIINSMVKAGKTPKTIRNYSTLINSVIKYAGYRPPLVRLPAAKKPQYHVPTEQEVKRLADCAKGTDLEIPIALATFGLRRGEICAVSGKDIDGTTLHIHKAETITPDGKYITRQPKTVSSDRYIEIPDALARKIKRKGKATDLTPSELSDNFRSFIRRNNFEHFRLHDLRHFFASYCHNVLGLSDKQIEKLGGWESDAVMRNRYMQSMNDRQSADVVSTSLSKLFGHDIGHDK